MCSALQSWMPFLGHVTYSIEWARGWGPEEGGQDITPLRKAWPPQILTELYVQVADGKAIASFPLQNIKLITCYIQLVSVLLKVGMIIYEKSFWDISFLKTKIWFNIFSNRRSQRTVEDYYKCKQTRRDFKSHNYNKVIQHWHFCISQWKPD